MYGDNVEIYDNTSNYLDSECKVVGLMGKHQNNLLDDNYNGWKLFC